MAARRISAADVLTVGNGVCGFLALGVLAGLWIVPPGRGLEHRELVACLLLYGIGMLCDVLDGPVARLLGSSGLGSGLDTICDTITFGLLPAMLLLARLQEALERLDHELFEKHPDVGDSLFGQRDQALHLGILVGQNQRFEQRVLAREVVVKRALAHADSFGDIAEAGAEKALLGKEIQRGIQDGLARALSVGISRASHRN